MRKLSQILAIMAILLAPLVAGGTAFAASTCPVGYTGPDSNNLCLSETHFECQVNTNNKVDVANSNNQAGTSGVSLSGGNTQSGSASTGSATNSNGVTFNVSVTNAAAGGGCKVVAVTVPATTTGTGQGAIAPKQTVPTVLPDTASDATSGYMIVIATALGLGAIVSYLAAVSYRHFQS